MKKFLISFNLFLGKIESFLLILILGVMIIFSVLQIILRSGFNSSLLWIDPLLRVLVLWSALIGGAKAAQIQKHITIDLFARFLPLPLETIRFRLLNSICSVLSFFLTVLAFRFLLTEKAFGEIAFLNVKMWHIELAFPFSFFLMGIHFFSNVLLPKDNP